MSAAAMTVRYARCLECGDEWSERDSPAICPECHSLEVTEIEPWVCVGCGCTDEHACPDGCSWVAPGLCSRCAA